MTNIITAEQFKQLAFQIIALPGFSKGSEPIHVKIRTAGVMNLIANGKIPNTLLGKVTELFGETSTVTKDNASLASITDQQKKEALDRLNKTDTGIQDMAELLRVFAEASMVEPTYAEVGEYMTDAQLMTIFSAMYGEVTQAETFRTDEGNV
jgi:hypothetical protein|nr:MAG TPA: hypothetical protein [Caudoviricetes sp.]